MSPRLPAPGFSTKQDAGDFLAATWELVVIILIILVPFGVIIWE